MDDIDPERTLHDAVTKHHLDIDPSDPKLKALVSYAILIGYNAGWHDHKALSEETKNGTKEIRQQ